MQEFTVGAVNAMLGYQRRSQKRRSGQRKKKSREARELRPETWFIN